MKARSLIASLATIAVALIVVVGYWYARAPAATQVKVGDVAPDLRLPLVLSNAYVSLSKFRGKPVLLAMFLSDCETCQREVPQIEKLHRRYLRRGLTVLGVSADPDKPSAKQFLRKRRLTFPVVLDSNGAAVRAAFGTRKFPQAYLLDVTGRVEAIYLGSVRWNGDAVKDSIEKLLPPDPAKR